MACRADVVYILKESSCPVIAVVLFPDIEQGPTIVAEVMRSNVQVLWGTDRLMGRLAETPASIGLPGPQHRSHGPPAAFPLGARRRGRDFSLSQRPARPPRPSPQPPRPRHPEPVDQRPRGSSPIDPSNPSPDHPERFH